MPNVVITITTTAAVSAPELQSASGWVHSRSAVLLARGRMAIHTVMGITPRQSIMHRRPSTRIRGAAGIRNMAAITPAEPTHTLSAPATLGSTAKADLLLRTWCNLCQHRVDVDPGEQAARYGADSP